MNTRKLILYGLAAALVFGIGNFGFNTFQTKSQLSLVGSSDPARQTDGVQKLMGRGVLFDALQGGAPKETRLAAVATLQRLAEGGKNKDAFLQLLQMLKDPDTESAEEKTHPVRDAAKDAVAAVGVGYVPELFTAAKDPDGNISGQSKEALKKIGKPLKEEMAKRLSDDGLRVAMGEMLAAIGPETLPLITPYLRAPLLKDDAGFKTQMIEVMGRFTVPEAAAPILTFKDDPNPNVRRTVVVALANIGQPIGTSVLVEALNNPGSDPSARAAAAVALGGLATPEANVALARALSDYDVSVATAAAAGLRRAGDKAAPPVAQALGSADAAVRARAADAAGGMSTLTLAQKALGDSDETVRATAVNSMSDILERQRTETTASPLTLAAVPFLMKALSDPSGRVSQNAVTALGRVGASAAATLVPLLSRPDETLAFNASQALIAIQRPAVDSLLPLVQEGKPGARWAAVTLGEIGDPRAASALETLAKSTDPDTAYAAQSALVKVQGRG